MKDQLALKIASLLAIVLFSVHWTDDVVRGIDRGGVSGFWGLLILAVWLYATVVHLERRSGLVIILIVSLFASAVPLLHMRGNGLAGGRIAGTSGVFFWVWTLIALGVAAMSSVLLSAHGLWRLWRSRAPR